MTFTKGHKINVGRHQSPERRKKASINAKAHGLGTYFKGKHFSEEHRKKLGAWQIGRKRPRFSQQWFDKHKEYWKSLQGKPNMKLRGRKNPFLVQWNKTHILRGKDAPGWRGGIYTGIKAIRASNQYRLWRLAVYERDNRTCVWCGYKSVKKYDIHADHIKPFAQYPELRFAIDNGRVLCIPCHKTTESYARTITKKI